MSGTNTFLSNAESATERILKNNKNLLFLVLFCKSSNDLEELKSFLQSNLETYQFQQRKF